ncbi:WD repeat domain-containing protein 83 [Tanacetum coccineum]
MIKIFDTFEDIVTSLCVKRTEIIAGSYDGSVQQFDLRNNKDTNGIETVGEYKGHTCESSKVGCCFTHGTTNVVGGSEDGRLFIWDMLSGVVDSESDAHSSAVTSVDYHPTNNCMITASMDGSVILWKEAM